MKLPIKLTTACTIALALTLSACAGKPQPPAWQPDAKSSLDGYLDDWLRGEALAADAEFARARRATASTGRFDRVAQAELVRCAARAAALVYDCSGFAALAADATPAQRAYAAYLDGRWQGLDGSLLPEQHRAVLGGGDIGAIADPLARLVAAGIAAAVDTASSQGWRRPLLAWLGLEEARARAAGDGAAAEHIRRRRALASDETP